SPIVGESAVADGGTGNGGKPSVEERVLSGQGGEHGNLFRRKIIHDGARFFCAGPLGGVALDEALHVGHAVRGKSRAAVNLDVYAGEVMVRIMAQLAAVVGCLGDFYHFTFSVPIKFISGQAIDFWI